MANLRMVVFNQTDVFLKSILLVKSVWVFSKNKLFKAVFNVKTDFLRPLDCFNV